MDNDVMLWGVKFDEVLEEPSFAKGFSLGAMT